MDSRFHFQLNDPDFIDSLFVSADSFTSAISKLTLLFGDSIMTKVVSITKLDSLWRKI